MTKLTYLPAYGQPDLDIDLKHNREIKNMFGFISHFANKAQSAYFHPSYLISYYYGNHWRDIRKETSTDQDVFIFSDSGGFEIVTKGEYINPEKVILWQQANSNAGVILDVPPYEKSESGAGFGEVQGEKFDICLEKTSKNVEDGLKWWSNEKFQLYGVVQGNDLSRIDKWYKRLNLIESKNREFSGWACSPKPSNDLKQIALHFSYIYDQTQGSKPLHFLQITGFRAMVFCRLLSKYVEDENKFTVDSSSFSYGRRGALFYNPYDIRLKHHFGDENKDNKLTELPCDCKICDSVNTFGMKNISTTLLMHLISLHNNYVTIKYVNFINKMGEDYDLLRAYAIRKFGGEIEKWITFVENSVDKGFDKAYNKNFIQNRGLGEWT